MGTITRSTWTDDDGSGTTGSILNNAELQKIYDNIDTEVKSATNPAVTTKSAIDKVTLWAPDFGSDGLLIDDWESDIAIAANVLTVNLATARHFKFTLNATITTMTIQNIPAANRAAWFVLKVIANGSAQTWSWFASTVKWGAALAPTPTITNAHWDMYLFLSYDGGTTWTGSVIDQNYS